MNTNTNLPFLESHGFPFFNRPQTSTVDSDNVSLKKSQKPFLTIKDEKELRREQRKRQVRQTKQCLKRFFTFLFSHIGLTGVLMGYVILGGLMFRNMEIDNEKDVKSQAKKNHSQFIKDITKEFRRIHEEQLKQFRTNIDISRSNNFTFDGFNASVTDDLEMYLNLTLIRYTKEIIHFMQDLGWNGNHDADNVNWSLEGAVLYVITVITTIGYGHVAPKTKQGKFMTMVYALLGIPLTFLYLSNIGDYLADWFRFIYHKICRKYCGLMCQKSVRHRFRNSQHFHSINQNSTSTRSAIKSSSQPQYLSNYSIPTTTNMNNTNINNMINANQHNLFHRTYRQFQNRWFNIKKGIDKSPAHSLNDSEKSKFYTNTNVDYNDENNSIQSDDTSKLKYTIKSHMKQSNNDPLLNNPFQYKSYGVAKYLPSNKTVKQRDALMINCISSDIPLINWKDIDKDLELGSLDNLQTDEVIINKSIKSNQFKELNVLLPIKASKSYQNFQNLPTPQLLPNNGSSCSTNDKLDLIDDNYTFTNHSATLDNQLFRPTTNKKVSPEFNFASESVRRVSYVSINNLNEHGGLINNTDDDCDNSEQQKAQRIITLKKATVPISLSLTTLFIYIIFGSVIFTIWEEQDYLKWSYFCFITLSTIGFGDIVPGTKVDSKNPKEKLVLVTLYVVMGLSVFAMCFKLMQEEVVAKFKRLGRRLGLLKNKKRKK